MDATETDNSKNKFVQIINDAKYVITTIAVIFTSFIGGYHVLADTFITKAYAESLVKDAQMQIKELRIISQQNTAMIIEYQLFELDEKASRTKLSPSERRKYLLLQKRLEKIQNELGTD